MRARLYQPSRTAMQSGRGKINKWVLEPEIETARQPEALMGWIASGDVNHQVSLSFDDQEAALAFADNKGWDVTIIAPQQRTLRGRSYMDNFAFKPLDKEA